MEDVSSKKLPVGYRIIKHDGYFYHQRIVSILGIKFWIGFHDGGCDNLTHPGGKSSSCLENVITACWEHKRRMDSIPKLRLKAKKQRELWAKENCVILEGKENGN